MTLLPSSPTIRGFTANNLRDSVRYLRRRLEHRIARGSAAAACLTDRSVDGAVCAAARAAAHASRRARRLARRLARVSLRRMVRGGPGVLPDGSLAALRRMVRRGPGVLPDGSLAALRRMVRSRRARCLARQLARIGPVRRIVRRIRCLPNGSRDNCLTGKIRYGMRSHTHQRRWAWAQAQSYSSWSVLTISRLMPAPRISLNEVITGPSEVEGLSGSTARPFYLSA